MGRQDGEGEREGVWWSGRSEGERGGGWRGKGEGGRSGGWSRRGEGAVGVRGGGDEGRASERPWRLRWAHW